MPCTGGPAVSQICQLSLLPSANCGRSASSCVFSLSPSRSKPASQHARGLETQDRGNWADQSEGKGVVAVLGFGIVVLAVFSRRRIK